MAKKDTARKKTTESKYQKVAFYLDKGLLQHLRDYQKDVGVPVSVSIRKAIEAYVEVLSKGL